jgi:hypothetical protein
MSNLKPQGSPLSDILQTYKNKVDANRDTYLETGRDDYKTIECEAEQAILTLLDSKLKEVEELYSYDEDIDLYNVTKTIRQKLGIGGNKG